ncbi:FMN-binding protein [bacterium]|nr:FMN-binding protein [bacterium]
MTYFKWMIILCIITNFCTLQAGARPEPADSQNTALDAPCDSTAVLVHDGPFTYQDGTYTGESTEWTGMTVQVRVKNGKINDVKVLKVKGTPEYYDVVVRKLPRCIEAAGHPDVDGISGATLSCDSMKKAVRNALEKAVKE